ncbi:MAG: FAD:protein FMN transferase [Candidatus Omnitrophota bacterium]
MNGIWLILVFSLIAGCSNNPSITKNTFLMDTFVQVKVKGGSRVSLKEHAIDATFTRMRALESKFTIFAEDGELAKINELGEGQEFALSDEMLNVLSASQDVNVITRGAFDITIGRAEELWFPVGGSKGLPAPDKLRAADESVGADKWGLDRDKKLIRFNTGGVKIDLGGIAKGFIVDEGIKTLKSFNISNALLNAGGDIYCFGEGGDRSGWRIGIRDPGDPQRIIATISVRDKGVATSGSYERFARIGSEELSHIIDPAEGRPLKKSKKSVTVVADTCMLADALATALYVMDVENGVRIIEGIEGADCIIVDNEGELYVSSGLKGKAQFGLTKARR